MSYAVAGTKDTKKEREIPYLRKSASSAVKNLLLEMFCQKACSKSVSIRVIRGGSG
jgi:hypothetical protein